MKIVTFYFNFNNSSFNTKELNTIDIIRYYG